ncbi:MAG: 4Fe-4S binding protein [Adlercreutzia equolifaciens]
MVPGLGQEQRLPLLLDACPYEAIELDENMRPVVIPDHCNGCGACQSVCVSQKEGSYTTGATSRAIIVVPESEA